MSDLLRPARKQHKGLTVDGPRLRQFLREVQPTRDQMAPYLGIKKEAVHSMIGNASMSPHRCAGMMRAYARVMHESAAKLLQEARLIEQQIENEGT